MKLHFFYPISMALLLGAFWAFHSKSRIDQSFLVEDTRQRSHSPYDSLFANHPKYIVDGFDFPVGKPDAKGYYNAQPFMKNTHLGRHILSGSTGRNADFAMSESLLLLHRF